MRIYYIFNVNKEMSILTKDSPYMLFKSFESIFRYGRDDLNVAKNMYNDLTCKFNQNLLNTRIEAKYKDNDFYYYTKNKHHYFNKYRNESCELDVKNNYLVCKCNSSRFDLLNCLNGFNLFVCDFQNKDYFWLDEIYC